MMIATLGRSIQEISRPAYTLGTEVPEADLRGCCGVCYAESQALRAAMGLMRPASEVRKSPVWYF